jgi:2-aminoadipate transaminase
MVTASIAPVPASVAVGAPVLAPWARGIRKSALQDLLSRAAHPDVLSLALGLPDPALFPAQALADAAVAVLHEDRLALQYAPHCVRLKHEVVAIMARRGVRCTAPELFLTTGAQQALSLLSRLLVDHRQQVIVEELTYPGFLQVLQPLQARVIAVPTHPGEGIDVEAIELHLKRGARPAFIYVMTEGHNPTTVSMSDAVRRRLIEVARFWHVPIVEDDAYGFLQYAEALRPPLRAEAPDVVFYVGSFAKIVAPALRVGWLLAPEEVMLPLSVLKESSDIDTTTLSQRICCAFLESGALPAHIETVRNTYRTKRDRMIASLEHHMIPGAVWSVPRSGVFLWMRLAAAMDAGRLLEQALTRQRLAFVPGAAFAARRRAAHASSHARLNFSCPALEAIDEGIARLARAVSSYTPG